MPDGKPAGVPCVQLMDDLRCAIFGRPERPACCGGLQASVEMCGDGREMAIQWLGTLEQLTAPGRNTVPA
ncbi:Fe-S-cluster oxidoreductase [Herbaspirillum hiltneri N3]|uniref:Fe-S-cluster oxidoreductase n=2 Tax=Herbaspirillum TaxID=963 RepID=A0ABM5UWJ4_9BURK|nr:Fe-S-cluster oxidoreductase [Herbaspirillum hiltneri N3]